MINYEKSSNSTIIFTKLIRYSNYNKQCLADIMQENSTKTKLVKRNTY